jgi:hypothetical protein
MLGTRRSVTGRARLAPSKGDHNPRQFSKSLIRANVTASNHGGSPQFVSNKDAAAQFLWLLKLKPRRGVRKRVIEKSKQVGIMSCMLVVEPIHPTEVYCQRGLTRRISR